MVSVWKGFLFLWVLGMGYVILLWHSLSLPYNYSASHSPVCFTQLKPATHDPAIPAMPALTCFTCPSWTYLNYELCTIIKYQYHSNEIEISTNENKRDPQQKCALELLGGALTSLNKLSRQTYKSRKSTMTKTMTQQKQSVETPGDLWVSNNTAEIWFCPDCISIYTFYNVFETAAISWSFQPNWRLALVLCMFKIRNLPPKISVLRFILRQLF